MTHDLIPWSQLTRHGVPALRVIRRPIVIGPAAITVGTTLNPEVFPLSIRRARLRQFYEQRRLEPVEAPKGSRQFARQTPTPTPRAGTPPVLPSVPVVPTTTLVTVSVPVNESASSTTTTTSSTPTTTTATGGWKRHSGSSGKKERSKDICLA